MLDSGWVAAFGTVVLGGATVAAVYADRRWRRRQEKKKEAVDRAEAPANELSAASKAVTAVASAAASLIAPFQATITQLQVEQGALREAVTVSRAAEEKCKVELAEVREKLREATDKLGIPPLPPSSQ